MPRKKNETPREKPEYDSIKTIKEVDKLIDEHEHILRLKAASRAQQLEAKKDMAASYNEVIKSIEEDMDHELGVISELERRKKVINATATASPEVQAVVSGTANTVSIPLPATPFVPKTA